MGYARAGFEVVGVDIKPQKNFPFEFVQADAVEVLRAFDFPLLYGPFDAIHASPPCQDHMQTPHRKHGTGWLLPTTRSLLLEQDAPWVIENVPGAPMRPDFKLCGCMFGLPGLRRERWFETSWHGFELALSHNHTDPTISVVGHGTPSWVREKLGRNPTIHEYRAAMGIDWMNRNELSQAIPPAYCELIGHQLMTHLRASGRVPDDSLPERTLGSGVFLDRKRGSCLSTDAPLGSESYARSHPGASAESAVSSRQSDTDLDGPGSRNEA